MKAEELRIGNFVGLDLKDFPDNYFEMYEVAEKASSLKEFGTLDIHYFDADLMEGIPLTKEWLIKFGFIKPNYSSIAEFYMGELELYYLTKDECYQFESKNIVVDLYFVHQLQNLYFTLFGEELKLNP